MCHLCNHSGPDNIASALFVIFFLLIAPFGGFLWIVEEAFGKLLVLPLLLRHLYYSGWL